MPALLLNFFSILDVAFLSYVLRLSLPLVMRVVLYVRERQYCTSCNALCAKTFNAFSCGFLLLLYAKVANLISFLFLFTVQVS